jgi:ribosomal protein S21
MINVEVERNNNENSVSLIKRFTRRVQGSGVLMRVRKNRFTERVKSPYVQKKQALKKLARKEKYDELVKMGKVAERTFGSK